MANSKGFYRQVATQANAIAPILETRKAHPFTPKMLLARSVYNATMSYLGVGRYEDDYQPSYRQTVGTH